jgi:natural product biosynthesis luciferase-like monooxygenase protein
LSSGTGPFRCALIGADTLLTECSDLLLQRGHDVVAIVAGSTRIAAWAHAHDLTVFDADVRDDVWIDQLQPLGIDYLFAVTHLRMLPAAAIALPARMAINFHDGPLPDYPGLNTPVWGLLNGENEWAVTWHLITEAVDAGDILIERRFQLSPRETSLSLNTSIVEQAIDSFSELIDRLTDDTAVVMPQPSTPRKVYRRVDRPDAFGVLDWAAPAQSLDRLVRALHFGPHPNPVGSAILWHPTSPAIAHEAQVVPHGGGTPGMVLAIEDAAIEIACARDALRIAQLTSLDGSVWSSREFANSAGLKVGSIMPTLSPAARDELTAAAIVITRHEPTQVDALQRLEPVAFPWPQSGFAPDGDWSATPIEWPAVDDDVAVAMLAVALARLVGMRRGHVALALPSGSPATSPLLSPTAPLELAVDPTMLVGDVRKAVGDALASARRRGTWALDLAGRTPSLSCRDEFRGGLHLPIGIDTGRSGAAIPGVLVALQRSATGAWQVGYRSAAVATADVQRFAECLAEAHRGLTEFGDAAVDALGILDEATRRISIGDWNSTDVVVDEQGGIHDLISYQASLTPDRTALECRGEALTYAQLQHRAAQLATVLRERGVSRDSLVGVYVDRSVELVVALLGVLQAGGAYLPLDPSYPADRLRHMIADSGTSVVVCHSGQRDVLPVPDDSIDLVILAIDELPADSPTAAPEPTDPAQLAYCIYTSGSTGLPKGVLVEHRNVLNFFAGMDAVVPRTGEDTWMAVTSLSFDISVLELLYTLARGFRVVIHVDHDRAPVNTPAAAKGMDFSLFYFSGDEAEDAASGKYRLLLEGAKFADMNGFSAVWTPERHFHAFGGLYPQPAVTAAAVAAVTERVSVRAGSVVMPLHHPIEVAEAWSVVDNLSNGRVGLSVASGWQPNDFVLRPANYANAKQVMFEGLDQVRRLWRGETLTFEGPEGSHVDVVTLPRPVQAELPIWVTTAGNPVTFEQAGAVGANLLTHLLGQSVEQLAPKIAAYRAARAAAGLDPATGIVSLMLHTSVGADDDEVRSLVREPLKRYLSTSFDLVREYAWSFPAFKRPTGEQIEHISDLADHDVQSLDPDELDAILEHAFDRYLETSGLFGTAERVVPFVDRLKEIGVDEIACLLDFGVPTDAVLAGLPYLARARERCNQGLPERASAVEDGPTIAQQILDAGVTHFQCTPSMARMLTLDPEARAALGTIPNLYVGGEALSPTLASDLCASAGGLVTNMYGPTETTIWSTTWQLEPGFYWVPIGSPIANTQVYVLDPSLQPMPPGVAGDLWIGGDGVVRGYHQRPELTAERFVTDPFRGAPGRMYFTGDVARWRPQPDGTAILEFLGRGDHQVKIRGYRVELGEVEAHLARMPSIDECVAVVREDSRGDQQLVAYVVGSETGGIDAVAIRQALRAVLPEVMVPSLIVPLPELPRTPNGKTDRNALPAPQNVGHAPRNPPAPPANDVQRTLLALWQQVLGANEIGIDDNFFDIGGHSLLVVRLHRALQEQIGRRIALTDLYRFPTVRGFSSSLTSIETGEPTSISTARDRAAKRRSHLRDRRD